MKKTIAISILLLAVSLVIYFKMPVINYGFWGLPALVFALNLIWIIIQSQQSPKYNASKQSIYTQDIKVSKASIAIFIALLLYVVPIPLFTSWGLLHTQDYRNLIGNIDNGSNFAEHMTPISIENIRVVDRPLAYLLGDKVLGAQPALGSQVTLGDFTIQKVNNNLYWVAPLVHSGFFKWNKNKGGTPGYVMVNATNERDVKLVQNINGKPIKIKYQTEAYFGSNIERHLYFNGYFSAGLADYTFEIDEEGNPFWVVTKYKKRIGFYGEDAVAAVVVNAETGQITEYPIDKAPLWIDRIQPEPFIEAQLKDWGEFVNGYWNFSNEDKLQLTEGLTLVYGQNNRSYWYTGLTSVGADEATVGFVLVDTRTKKAVWYKQGGATEFAAQNSAMGKVQEKGYYASMPIPYNINNIPTYVMTLKDRGGLVKMYALVAIQDYTIVGVGNSLNEALMAYKNAYNMTGNKLTPESITKKLHLKSVVNRINSDIKNGNSFYYFTLEGSTHIFIGSTQISNQLPVTAIGDSAIISYDDDNESLIGISTFENLTLKK